MIKFKCPHCGKEVSAGDEHAGKKGRCPGCKELFVIPAAAAPKPAPPAGDYDPDDPDAVEELKKRVGVKVVKRKPDRGMEDDEDDEPPRRKKSARDEDDEDEAIAEAPRRRRPARDEDDEDEDRPAKKRRGRDEEDEDDEPRARRKRGRDDGDGEDDEDDRPRRKRRTGRKGPYARCPNCGCRGDATRVYYTFGWGILPTFFRTVRCNHCGTEYNGKHGDYNTKRYLIYMAIVVPIAVVLGIISAILESK